MESYRRVTHEPKQPGEKLWVSTHNYKHEPAVLSVDESERRNKHNLCGFEIHHEQYNSRQMLQLTLTATIPSSCTPRMTIHTPPPNPPKAADQRNGNT